MITGGNAAKAVRATSSEGFLVLVFLHQICCSLPSRVVIPIASVSKTSPSPSQTTARVLQTIVVSRRSLESP